MRLLALALLLASAASAVAQQKSPPLKKGVNEVDIAEGKYWLDIPNSYDGRKPTPVIVFLHGKTIDLNADNARGQIDNPFVAQMKKRGWIAMAPVMPKEHRPHWFENGGSLSILDAMMNDLKKKVVTSYIVCSGFSAGANYTMGFGQHRSYHTHFAGYLVMAGGGWVDKDGPEDLKRKPIWLGCGDQDNDSYDDKLNTTGGARKTAAELKEAKFESAYDEFPKVGHVMDPKMVEKAVAWVDAHIGDFQAIGAFNKAGQLKDSAPGEGLRALEGAGKAKCAEYWAKKVEAGVASLTDAAKRAIAEAEGNADAAQAKAALTKLGQEYVGTSVEKLVKEAMGRAGQKK